MQATWFFGKRRMLMNAKY